MTTSARDQRTPLRQTWLRLLRIPNVRRLAETRVLTNMYFYSAVLVRFEMDRGLNFTEIFLLESVLSLAIWLLDIPTGVWADRIGYRRLLIVSRLLNAASVMVTLFAHGFLLFAVGSILFGAGVACDSGCEDAILIRTLTNAEQAEGAEGVKNSSSAFALLGAASSAGFFIGLVTGSLFAAHDPTIAVVATLFPATLAIGVTWMLRPFALHSDVGEAEIADIAEAPARPLAQAWRLIRREPALVGLSLVQSASWVCVNAIFWYNQPLLGRAGVAAQWFGPLTAIAVVFGVVVPLLTPLARRWLSRRACFGLSLLTPGLAYLALARVTQAWAVVALLALVVGGSAWREPLLREALNERIDDRARATTLSALSFIGAVAGALANALVGRAGDAGLIVVGYSLGLTLLALGLLAPWLMAPEPVG
ncbi:MAG TPA: MFS transporter [Ktedonobacterales bacterium]|jgi:MFS family permease|nr:MFS transporter [Ktedonobacterales bacterium]